MESAQASIVRKEAAIVARVTAGDRFKSLKIQTQHMSWALYHLELVAIMITPRFTQELLITQTGLHRTFGHNANINFYYF